MVDKSKKQAFSRRQFLRVSALAATGVVAAACAPAAATPTEQPAAPAAEQPEAEAPAAEAPAGGPTPEPTAIVGQYGSGSGTPVLLWSGLTGADGATFAEMLQQYAEEFPDRGVRSELYVWDTLYQKLPTAIAAGTPPDMNLFHVTEIEPFTRQGLMQPLDNIMYNSGLVPKDDFAPAIIEAITVDGNIMAVPFDNHGWMNFVNTKLLSEAGLDPENLPKNGEEFIEWAYKLTVDENGRHPDEDGFGTNNVKTYAIWHTWPRFTMPTTFRMYSTDIMTEDKTTSLLNSEASIAAVKYWHDLMYEHRVCPPAVPGIPWAGDIYKTDGLAFMWEGSWSLNYFRDNPDVAEHTIAAFVNSLSPDGKQVVKIDAHTMCIPAGVSEDGVERASHLIKWLSDNGEFWATSGQVPARLSVQNSPTVQEGWSTRVAAEEFSTIGQPDINHRYFNEIQVTWEAAVSAALANTQPLEEAMEQGHQQLQAILDRP